MHIIEHAFFDTIKIIPFIFLIYIVIEYIEHKSNTWTSHKLMDSKKTGVLYGALLGSVPQCGFSVIAADLYSKKAITMGTLIAIFIATSDEAVPIILASPDKAAFVVELIIVKLIIAVIFGVLIDIFHKKENLITACEREEHHEHFHGNCEDCEDGILKSAIKHTVKIFIFVFIATLVLSLTIETVGEDKIASYLLKNSTFQPFIASLIGLIPNCAASVVLTQSFLSGAISFGSLIAGLCSGAGIGILLLIKRNKNAKQNFFIISALYVIGSLSGMIINLIGF